MECKCFQKDSLPLREDGYVCHYRCRCRCTHRDLYNNSVAIWMFFLLMALIGTYK
jgi:hypothetical protein